MSSASKISNHQLSCSARATATSRWRCTGERPFAGPSKGTSGAVVDVAKKNLAVVRAAEEGRVLAEGRPVVVGSPIGSTLKNPSQATG